MSAALPRSELILAKLRASLFGKLGESALAEAQSLARIERWKSPALLNPVGEPLQALRLVLEGHIELISRRASGKEVMVSQVQAGAWATWLPCITDRNTGYEFRSSANALYLALPVPAVREFCTRHPQIYPLIIGEMGDRMSLLVDWFGQSVLMAPPQRMAKLILLLACDQKVSAPGGTLQVNQQRLAALARCSRQSANVLLRELEEHGLISLSYGKCEIPSLQALAAYAETDASEPER